MNNINTALSAYQQALGRISANNGLVKTVDEAAQNRSDFQNMVKEAVVSVQQNVKNSENMALAGMQGKADIQDVVLAISNAEVALDTVVAVRDTAIKAYKEIMQMTI